MLRSRVLRPGIITNEVLAKLGPEATLLFERLWMIADREGRLEDRPARIRAECFPYWPKFPVEKLLKTLSKAGFIQRYADPSDGSVALIFVVNFQKYQPIHPHESRSALSPPSTSPQTAQPKPATAATSSTSNTSRRDMSLDVITCHDMSANVRVPLPLPLPVDVRCNGGERAFSTVAPEQPFEKAPPPLNKTGDRKQPGRATTGGGDRSGQHPPEEVARMRRSLDELAGEIRMPPPDDGIVRQILDAARGATAVQIEAALAALYKRDKFRAMRSWGFLPVIVADCFARPSPLAAHA